jgi:hypothetical protein
VAVHPADKIRGLSIGIAAREVYAALVASYGLIFVSGMAGMGLIASLILLIISMSRTSVLVDPHRSRPPRPGWGTRRRRFNTSFLPFQRSLFKAISLHGIRTVFRVSGA